MGMFWVLNEQEHLELEWRYPFKVTLPELASLSTLVQSLGVLAKSPKI